MLTWRPLAPLFLDETLRASGLGDWLHRKDCGSCGQPFHRHPDSSFHNAPDSPPFDATPPGSPVFDPPSPPPTDLPPTPLDLDSYDSTLDHGLFARTAPFHPQFKPDSTAHLRDACRCTDCDTLGTVECLDCIFQRHTPNNPLHFIERWTGRYWERSGLGEFGLPVQLCHNGGQCPAPQPGPADFVVLDVNGLHRVNVAFCACHRGYTLSRWQQLMRAGWYPATHKLPATAVTTRALDQFQLLNLIGHLNVHDYIGTAETLTQPSGLGKVPVSIIRKSTYFPEVYIAGLICQ